MWLSENQIELLESDWFSGMNNLQILQLSSNKMSSLKSEMFANMRYLKELSLNNNRIEFIEANAFVSLENLEQLYLYNNKLKLVQEKTFASLTKLQLLWLHENKIKTIDLNSFDQLANLNQLVLYSNELKVIKEGTFNNLNNLLLLKLANNQIEDIDSKTLGHLSSVQMIILDSNRIRQIKSYTFNASKSLRELWINFNQIVDLEKNAFFHLENLQSLSLYSNRIKFIRNETFVKLKSLSKLMLFQNEVESIEINSFADMLALSALSLNLNKIKCIVHGVFNGLVRLLALGLDKNEIVSIERHSFDDLRSLKELHLFSNKLETISSGVFTNLAQLEYLNVSFNRLNTIERSAFTNLASLSFLDLSHNYLDGLVDCFEGVFNLYILDLSFNFIKIFENSFDFPLDTLYMSSNVGSKAISLAFIKDLQTLYLEFYGVSSFENENFLNLPILDSLHLSNNKIRSVQYMRLNALSHLTLIDLAYNLIETIRENDFSFSIYLEYVNLNHNPIKLIHPMTFDHLTALNTLRISSTQPSRFDLGFLRNCHKLIDLDLSFNYIQIQTFAHLLTNIQVIRLDNVTITVSNASSFEIFLNRDIMQIDFSNNDLNENYRIFDFVFIIEKLVLRNTKLKSFGQINVNNFPNLTHLDLSFNNISIMDYDSFARLQKLVYLDLSTNRISFVDDRIFSTFSITYMKPLRYLNLENNLIVSLGDSFNNMCNMVTFKVSNNVLNSLPSFYVKTPGTLSVNAIEFYFNNNNFSTIPFMSDYIRTLLILNFDCNQIGLIAPDALFNLKNLLNLSIANNNLSQIYKETFAFQFNLKYLNLSRNRIGFIAPDSFQNLGNLLILDLSFNMLMAIENSIFKGLTNLNDLYLLNNIMFELRNESFRHLTNISSLHLSDSLVIANKCLFMHSIQRPVLKNSSNGKIIFFKSLNLVSPENKLEANLTFVCEVTYQFLQFKVHFNLKTEYENELFYEKCGDYLAQKNNDYNHNYQNCFQEFKFNENIVLKNSFEKFTLLEILANPLYLITMVFLVLILLLSFILISLKN